MNTLAEEKERRRTQRKMILSLLKQRAALTGFELFQATGSMRYGARIFELRRKGYDIRTTRIGVGIYSYRLEDATS